MVDTAKQRTQFAINTPLSRTTKIDDGGGTLSPVIDAIQRSKNGMQTGFDDITIGSEYLGTGFCSMTSTDPSKNYAGMQYCACVNAPIANPECSFRPCTRSGAYLTTKMRDTRKNNTGPHTVVCNQLVQMMGKDNLMSNLVQIQNCSADGKRTVTKKITNAGDHTTTDNKKLIIASGPMTMMMRAFIVFIVLVVLALLVRGGGSKLPPPEFVFPALPATN
jgi:hypothetical protein